MAVLASILRKLPDSTMPSFLQSCLSMHALTGCDSVAAIYGLGKTKTITVARKGYTLDLLGQPMADIDKVVKQATVFIAAC